MQTLKIKQKNAPKGEYGQTLIFIADDGRSFWFAKELTERDVVAAFRALKAGEAWGNAYTHNSSGPAKRTAPARRPSVSEAPSTEAVFGDDGIPF